MRYSSSGSASGQWSEPVAVDFGTACNNAPDPLDTKNFKRRDLCDRQHGAASRSHRRGPPKIRGATVIHSMYAQHWRDVTKCTFSAFSAYPQREHGTEDPKDIPKKAPSALNFELWRHSSRRGCQMAFPRSLLRRRSGSTTPPPPPGARMSRAGPLAKLGPHAWYSPPMLGTPHASLAYSPTVRSRMASRRSRWRAESGRT